jgi:hypothetical protein
MCVCLCCSLENHIIAALLFHGTFVLEQCYTTSVLPPGFRCTTDFYKKLHIYTYLEKAHFYLSSSVVLSNIHNFCFHLPAFLQGKCLCVVTYLWSRIILYIFFVRQHFVEYHHVWMKTAWELM